MAAPDVIVIGIGPGSNITELILFGLSTGEAPPPPDDRVVVLANSGVSAMSGGMDDLEVG